MIHENPDFENLRRAALTVSTRLLGGLTDRQLSTIEKMVRSGGRLILEIGPMPDARTAKLVLVEHEGRRVPLAVHQT